LEHVTRYVGLGLGLDYPAPYDRAQALRAHRDADTERAVGLEFHPAARARERRMLGVEVLAKVGAVPELRAPVVGIDAALEGFAQRGVVDRQWHIDLRLRL